MEGETPVRINNAALLYGLEALSWISNNFGFYPIHLATRQFHLCVTQRLLFLYFHKNIKEVRALHFRHSIQSQSAFHCLLSDLDVTLVLNHELNSPVVLRNLISRLRRKWVMIGEFEVYTDSEMAEKEVLESQLGPLYKFVRGVRKISWLEPTTRPYHRYKRWRSLTNIKRSLVRALRRARCGLSEIEEKWRIETGRLPLGGFQLDDATQKRVSSYLGPNLIRLQRGRRFRHFLVSLPGTLSDSMFEQLRPEEIRIHLWFCQHERIVVCGRMRLDGDLQIHTSWLDVLDREITRCRARIEMPA